MKAIEMKTIGLAMLVVLLGACEKKDSPENDEIKGTNVTAKTESLDKTVNSTGNVINDNNILNCYYDDSIGFDEMVIRDNLAYQELGEVIKTKGICNADSLPDVDFSKNSLIGKYVSGGGCNVNFDCEVYDDAKTKTITYRIKTEFTGACAMFIYSWNWRLIPKIDDEYAVKFIIDKE